MLLFLLGLFVGVTLGFVAAGLMWAASRDDERH
jgi:type III secretory pathway component EscT